MSRCLVYNLKGCCCSHCEGEHSWHGWSRESSFDGIDAEDLKVTGDCLRLPPALDRAAGATRALKSAWDEGDQHFLRPGQPQTMALGFVIGSLLLLFHEGSCYMYLCNCLELL